MADLHRHRPGPSGAGDRARRQRARARSSPTRSWARWWRATARCWARAGTKSSAGAHAEVNAIEACGLDGSERGDAVRVARAVLPRGQDAAVHRRDPAGAASGAWSSPPTTPPRRPPVAGSGILRDEGVEVVRRRRRAGRARAAAQPGVSQARPRRAPVGAVQVGDDARRQGRHAHRATRKWISGEDSRELAHRWRASVDAVVVGIGTALADDPQLTARPDGLPAELPHQPRRVVFDSLARLPPTSQLVAAAAEIPLTVVVSRAAARADTDALEAAGVQVLWPPARTSRRACARRSTSSARWASPRCCWRAARTSPARSSTPARSTRSGCSWRRCCSAGARRAIRWRAKGVERISEALRALTFDCESVGEDLLISARLREW